MIHLKTVMSLFPTSSRCLTFSVFLLQLLSLVCLQRMGIEVDIGWEFESDSKEGWGNATSEV